jgi:coenzyme F420-reducing hydrogenase gamma subunit
MTTRPKLAVWKFSSCDGCQLTLLNCEEELLAIAGAVHVAYFPEASREMVDGPYDLSLVEGSVSTPEEAERIRRIRRESKILVAIGACATAGGIQALRNFTDTAALTRMVYPEPAYIETLETSTAISDHVAVDFELRGCPIDKGRLLELITAYLHGRQPSLPSRSVCTECKARGIVCLTVARGVPCLGPVTHAGCGALCPAYDRGCYGCFGPKETPNPAALGERWRELGVQRQDLVRALRTFNANAPAFREESEAHEQAG